MYYIVQWTGVSSYTLTLNTYSSYCHLCQRYVQYVKKHNNCYANIYNIITEARIFNIITILFNILVKCFVEIRSDIRVGANIYDIIFLILRSPSVPLL